MCEKENVVTVGAPAACKPWLTNAWGYQSSARPRGEPHVAAWEASHNCSLKSFCVWEMGLFSSTT